MASLLTRKFKQSFFKSFDQLKCYGLTSHTLLYLVFVARILTYLTAISYKTVIFDPAFNFLIYLKDHTTIAQTFLESSQMQIVIIFVLFLQLIYLYSLGTLIYNENGILRTIKKIIIKSVSFLTFCLRITIIRIILRAILAANTKLSYCFLVLLFIVFGLFIFIAVTNEMFCVQITLIKSSKTLLSKNYHSFNVIGQILLVCGIVFGIFLFTNGQFQFLVSCHCILLLAFSLKLWVLITRKKYYFSQTQNLQIFQCNLCIIFYLLLILGKFVPILEQNLFLTMIIMSIFSQMAILAYKNSQNEMSLCYLNPSFQKSNLEYIVPQISMHQAQSLIYHISWLMKQYKSQKQYILLISLITEHLRTCENNECYHHQYQELSLSKKQMIENETFRSKFLFSFIQNIFFYYSQNFQIWTLYHAYKLQIALNFPQIQSELEKYKLNRQKLSFTEQFAIYQIQNILQKFIQDKNSSIKLIHVQKVILQQEKSKEIIGHIRQVLIETKQRFEALQANIVNLNFVDSIISNVTKNIRKIQKLQTQSFQKYQYNIFTQELFLFYYNFIVHSLSQSNRISKIINNKLKYLKSLKGNTMTNIQKFMYQQKCCVIQSNLNPQKMGFISNATQNCLSLFGFKKKELIHESVNKLMPRFFNQEHDKLLQNFLKTGNFTGFGHNIQSFAVKKGVCFKVLINIQISTSYNCLKLYTLIMKINDTPNVMIDLNGFIQGYSQKLIKMFDSTCLNDQFNNFCLNFKQFPENLALKNSQKFEYLIVSNHNKEQVKQLKRLNLNLKDYFQKIKKYLNSDFQKLQNNITVYCCQVQISRIKFGKIIYFNMKFHGINQAFISSQKIYVKQILQNHLNMLSRTSRKKSLQKKLQTMKNLQPKKVETFCDFRQKRNNSIQKQSEKVTQHKTQEQNREIGQSTASMMSTQGSYYLQKLLKIIKEKFLNKNKISFRELDIATCVILILVLAIVGLLIVEFTLFSNGLGSFQSVVTANQNISYTLQLLELLYNKAMLMYQYCVILPTIPGRCQEAVTATQYMQNYLFEELSSQFQELMNFKANDGFYNYYYLMQPITFRYGDMLHSIQTFDFIENCYYSFFEITNDFKTMITDSYYNDQMFITLKENWNTIKLVNKQAASLYANQGSQILDILKFQLEICSGFIMLLAFFIVFTQRRLNTYMENKQQKIVRLNQNIPVVYLEQIKIYYEQILDKVNQGQFWQRDEDSQIPTIQQNVYHRPKDQFIYEKSKIQYIFLILFLVLMGVAVFYSFYSMTQFFPSFKGAQLILNQFVDSQRSVLENYFDLKQLFLFDGFDSSNLTTFNNLYNQMYQVQIKYNKISLQVYNIFTDSQSYQDDIKYYLTENICVLSTPYLSSWQNSQCIKNFFNFYKYGVILIMSYNERTAVYAALTLQQAPYIAPYIYASDTFYDIDRNSMYLIQIFKLIQNRINVQIQTRKQAQVTICLMAFSFEFAMLVLVLFFWAINYKKSIQTYSDLYGHIIVFPLPVLTKSNMVLKIVQQNLQLNNF